MSHAIALIVHSHRHRNVRYAFETIFLPDPSYPQRSWMIAPFDYCLLTRATSSAFTSRLHRKYAIVNIIPPYCARIYLIGAAITRCAFGIVSIIMYIILCIASYIRYVLCIMMPACFLFLKHGVMERKIIYPLILRRYVRVQG